MMLLPFGAGIAVGGIGALLMTRWLVMRAGARAYDKGYELGRRHGRQLEHIDALRRDLVARGVLPPEAVEGDEGLPC
jgi:hypothetical protein